MRVISSHSRSSQKEPDKQNFKGGTEASPEVTGTKQSQRITEELCSRLGMNWTSVSYSESTFKPENSKVLSGDIYPQTVTPDGRRSVQQRAQQGKY